MKRHTKHIAVHGSEVADTVKVMLHELHDMGTADH